MSPHGEEELVGTAGRMPEWPPIFAMSDEVILARPLAGPESLLIEQIL